MQGGVVSAVLFIVFTNDIVKTTNYLKSSIYADDTCIMISIERDKFHESAVMAWFSANQLDKLIILVSGQIITGLTKRFTRTTSRHTIAPKFLYENRDQYNVRKKAKEIIKKGQFILYDLH